MNAVVGYQLMDDGTPLSLGLTVGSALAVFVATAYVAADTGFDRTGNFKVTDHSTVRNYALYVLYLLFPLLLVVAFFILESVLVLGVLREKRPMSLSLLPPSPTCEFVFGKANFLESGNSTPLHRRCLLHHQSDLQLYHQRTHMPWHGRKNRRRPFRDDIRVAGRGDAVVLLELNHRG